MDSIEDVLTLNYIFTDHWFGKYRQPNYYNWAIELKLTGEVMKKCGMIDESTMRQATKCHGGLFDKVNYAILADEYFNTRHIHGGQ